MILRSSGKARRLTVLHEGAHHRPHHNEVFPYRLQRVANFLAALRRVSPRTTPFGCVRAGGREQLEISNEKPPHSRAETIITPILML